MRFIVIIALVCFYSQFTIGQKQLIPVHNGYVLLDLHSIYLKQNYDITDSDLRNDIMLSGLKGKVQQLEHNEYKYIGSEDSLSVSNYRSSGSFTFVFDTANNIIQEWELYKFGTPKQKTYYKCYSCNCIDSVVIFPKTGSSYKQIEFQYFNDIQIGESSKIDGLYQQIPYQQEIRNDTLFITKQHTKSFYVNNQKGAWARLSEPFFNVRYKYFDNGNIKSTSLYKGERLWNFKEYNLSGDLIYKEEFPAKDESNILVTRKAFEYNEYRSKIKETISVLSKGGTENKSIKYEYAIGLIRLINENNGISVDTSEIYLNEFEDILSYSFNKEKIEYRYIYDINGNWIKRIKFQNGIPIIINTRDITYWD